MEGNSLTGTLINRAITIACAQKNNTGLGPLIDLFSKPLHHKEKLDKPLLDLES
jgi:hypothetical protein